ncbi:GIY-YIG nuclease family protein [Chlorobaculum sp. MV4-Y]|jgi:Uri superfamily endonuclease|uniref:GIY-YIG nuclease family protein n=1 Tax=Chlorobaculum sp. MV4-Y TaxID=2976335 RepID=UPI0021AEAF23|nr:GIY-YIG nuclease family protein [Chlorobaculum sp. MV4-Y]UWX57841.1 GIY-YIG nuclease family protein [Chlorobaculum sp. MV4-Y]
MQYTIFGQNSRQGSYILLIELDRRIKVAFGKFRKGRPLELQPGHYLYVGSALGSAKGRSPLASRLLRHASRSDGRPAHAIRSALLDLFMSWGYRVPAGRGMKKLHWHIDYLLDRPEAEIRHVFIFPGETRLESQLAELLAAMPETSPIADRLGAQDATAGTHLFRINEQDALLPRLEKAMPELIRQG